MSSSQSVLFVVFIVSHNSLPGYFKKVTIVLTKGWREEGMFMYNNQLVAVGKIADSGSQSQMDNLILNN